MLRSFSSIIFILSFSVSMMVQADRESVAELELSEEEQQWLEEHPSVSFAGDPNWLPYEAFDKNGKYIGIVAEHLRLISESSSLEFKISPSNTWTESTKKAKQGMVDILSETDDSDLKSYLNFTIPYISNQIVIVMHSRENYVESISNINNKKIALIKDYGYTSKIRREYSDINFITVDDIQNGLIAVSTGEIDALLCTLALCSYHIANLGLNNVKITGKTEFDTKLALGVQKNLPELLSILNKSIKTISREQQQEILDSWIKNKIVEKADYTLAFQIAVVAIILLAIFILWNRRLSLEVALRKSTEKELNKAQEILRLSNQRLQSHRDHTPMGVIEWNRGFEILDWNQAAEDIFGFTKEEVFGKHITENILPDITRDAVDVVWDDLINARGGKRSTNENITKDGRTILCEWYNTSLLDQDGEVIGVASLVEDVTERRQSELELEEYRTHLEVLVEERTVDLAKARDEAERANVAKSEFLSRMSHELRTPMNAILGFGQILDMSAKGLDKAQKGHVKEIIDAGHHLLNLINELLDLAQIESGEPDIEIERVSLSQLLKQCITLVSTQAEARHIEIIDNVSSNDSFVKADATRLKQVLLNLLSNAVKYNSENGQITLDSELIGEQRIRFSVMDTGKGLTKEEINKLFVPFERLGAGPKVEGVGIGLVITKHLIEVMGGAIGVKSGPDEGSTFWIEMLLANEK